MSKTEQLMPRVSSRWIYDSDQCRIDYRSSDARCCRVLCLQMINDLRMEGKKKVEEKRSGTRFFSIELFSDRTRFVKFLVPEIVSPKDNPMASEQ